MNSIPELFWQASLAEIKQGYIFRENTDEYICLICGRRFTNGVIFPEGDLLYEARKYVELHIAKEHQSVFHFLLNLDKKLTGLTDHQKAILELFHQGLSDDEAAKTLNIKSTSTIRNHRFSLREKQKQAKVFLAIMELLSGKMPQKQEFIEIPRNVRQVDERFAITEQENEKILAAAFTQGLAGPLAAFPHKEKKKVAILRHLATLFEPNKSYSEKEVNEILKPIYSDYVQLRRYLIEYGFMDRARDGSAYWIKL